jgi:sn-glycerol 3-phosphate transport system permease protein
MIKNKKNIDKIVEPIRPYLYILPAFIIFTLFMFWPLVRTFYLSFFEWNMISPTKEFVGFDNYINIFKDPTVYKIFGNTIAYIIILLLINFIAPYFLSFILVYLISRGKDFYKSAIFMPSVISLVVGSILYLWILNPISGPAAIICGTFGINIPIWTKSEGLVIIILSLITSWKIFGYNFIIVFAGINGVSKEVIEAAKIDDVPLHKIFLDIIIPLSSATGIYVFTMTIVQGLQYIFTPIKVITQGGPDYASSNAIYNSYQEAFVLYRTGIASAFAILTMFIFISLLILQFKFMEKGVHYEN